MSANDFNELFAHNFIGNTELPLQIMMQDYKTLNDPWHRHNDFYELVFVCSGQAYNENEFGSTLVKGGDIFLFPAGSVHRYRDIKNFWHYNILFTSDLLTSALPMLEQLPGYEKLFQMGTINIENACSQFLSVDEFVLTRLIYLIEQVRNELALRSPGWQTAAYFSFLQFLTHFLRNCYSHGMRPDSNIQQIGKIIRILEEDSRKNYTLQELANEVHMSVSSFRQHFTAVTGLSPIKFLMKVRIKKSLLLLCSSISITRVAEQTGFKDSNYFSRQFKIHTGLTPREFQKKYKKTRNTLEKIMQKL